MATSSTFAIPTVASTDEPYVSAFIVISGSFQIKVATRRLYARFSEMTNDQMVEAGIYVYFQAPTDLAHMAGTYRQADWEFIDERTRRAADRGTGPGGRALPAADARGQEGRAVVEKGLSVASALRHITRHSRGACVRGRGSLPTPEPRDFFARSVMMRALSITC